jgi:hypothetical protein
VTLGRSDLVAELLDRTAEAYELVGNRERAVATWEAAATADDQPSERASRLRRAAQLEVDAGRYEYSDHLVARAAACLAGVPPGPVHVWLGPDAPYPAALAGWFRGRATGDTGLVRRGADELAALGFVYEAAAARLDLAELDGDAPLEDCARTVERLGAQPLLDRARRLLRRSGRRPSPHRPRPAPLSAREEQIARLPEASRHRVGIAGRVIEQVEDAQPPGGADRGDDLDGLAEPMLPLLGMLLGRGGHGRRARSG